ncbi:helix-turn-helix domain-containing protein [Christensenellaceae bacterium OttesenSCG-928-L17]|nr:helix-turn-helix domain-containing protein [Christensenellaceae bacterium OttesenSCG-928-L17]
MDLGERIKAILEEKGMTIKGLADLSGVPANTIYAMTKKNGSKAARPETLARIADALNVDVGYLFSENYYFEKHGIDMRSSEYREYVEKSNNLEKKVFSTTSNKRMVKLYDLLTSYGITYTDYNFLQMEFYELLKKYNLTSSQYDELVAAVNAILNEED